MANLKLSLGERLNIITLLNDFRGKINGIYQVLKIIEKVELSEAERKEYQSKIGKEKEMIKTIEKEKQIDFTTEQTDLLKTMIEGKQDFQPNRFIVSLSVKLGIITEEK